MKWYFASRTRHQKKLLEVSLFLERTGEQVLSDWVYLESLTPYAEHVDRVQKVSAHLIAAILDADIFVLMSDQEGTDMFVELGVCLAKHTLRPNSIKLYIVGEHGKRSLMQMHPAIIHATTLQEVFEKEGIKCTNFGLLDFSS